MTRISYIAGLHGEGQDEVKDRSAGLKPAPYFNPLLMTEGGAYLRLMRDQVETLAQYYPDKALYRKGLALIDNSLYQGIHGATPYMGALDPGLYPIARAIDVYKTRRQPASRPMYRPGVGAASWQDESLIAGEIPTVAPDFALWWWNTDQAYLKSKKVKDANAVKKYVEFISKSNKTSEEYRHYLEVRTKYDTLKYVVDLYNNTLEKFAHHPLYNFLPQTKENYPGYVITKNVLHSAGVQSMANAGEFSTANMSLWTRNSILRANITGNAGAISPENTIFTLTGLPADQYGKFIGVTSSNKSGKINSDAGIGNPVVLAVIALISAAIAAAAKIIESFNAKQIAAMNSVQGWGTSAYSATERDWNGYGVPPEVQPPTAEAGTNWPLILGAGAGLYLLTQK